MKIWVAVALILSCITLLNAQTNLTGNIGGMTLEQSGNPFIVMDNVTIPTGKSLIIKEGCVFLFKPFTGIIVDGSLIVEGAFEKPVVFTSVNNNKYNPEATILANPFDWNGILITPKAGKVKLSNFVLEFSVYGVKSQKEELTINNGTFVHNGQYNVMIKDIIKPVADNLPFALVNSKEQTAYVKNSNWRKPFAIGTGVIGIAGLGVTGYFMYQRSEYAIKYTKASTQVQRDNYFTKQESYLSYAVISGITSGVLLSTGIVLYFWNNKKSNDKVTISPIMGNTNGIMVGLNF